MTDYKSECCGAEPEKQSDGVLLRGTFTVKFFGQEYTKEEKKEDIPHGICSKCGKETEFKDIRNDRG